MVVRPDYRKYTNFWQKVKGVTRKKVLLLCTFDLQTAYKSHLQTRNEKWRPATPTPASRAAPAGTRTFIIAMNCPRIAPLYRGSTLLAAAVIWETTLAGG
jgi:hypothetical protein